METFDLHLQSLTGISQGLLLKYESIMASLVKIFPTWNLDIMDSLVKLFPTWNLDISY